MLYKPALLTLAIAHKEAIGADIAAASSARLALLPEPLLTVDALAIEAEVALLALLALESIIAALTVDIDVVRAEFAEAVLDEGALDAPLVREGVRAEQNAGRRDDHGDHEDAEKVVAARRAFEAGPALEVVVVGLRDFENEHFDHHLTATGEN